MRKRRTCAVTVIIGLVVMVATSPAFATPKTDGPSSAGGRCNPKKTVCVEDTSGESVDESAPSISVATPTSDATVSGIVSVTGSAADDVGIAKVEVQLDGGGWTPATGTTSWSHELDTSALDDGAHTIAARVTDTSGNATAAATAVTVSNASAPADDTIVGDTIVGDPAAQHDLAPIGRTRMPQWGSLTGVLYSEQWTDRKVVFFRDSASGATSAATLPSDSPQGWYHVAAVMTSPEELWVVGGIGPLQIRQYRLSGSPMPDTATLVSSLQVGDADSRPGDLLRLENGSLVAIWHQQGQLGPTGLHLAHLPVGGTWRSLPALTFTNTTASNQVLAQHPADGSVWLFHNADAAGKIDAVRLIEREGALEVTTVYKTFIVPSVHGLDGPDPENPFLSAAVDPVAKTLHLAYQSADRRYFGSGDRLMAGSRVAVATIGTAGERAFDRAPVWAERVSALSLMIDDGEPVISYSPVDEVTLTADAIEVLRRSAGVWGTPIRFGERDAQTYRVAYATGRVELATKLSDGRIHLRTF